MSTKALSPSEVRRVGIEALNSALGPVDMVRFLQQFENGSGNYSVTRDEVLGDARVNALAEEIRLRRESRSNNRAGN